MPSVQLPGHVAQRFFFIVGGQRCGSTLLRRMLDTHPDIAMLTPERPEPRSFIGSETPQSASAYLARFSRTAYSVLGEKSTSYLDRPESALAIRAAIPDAAIVAVVREPIDRAISHFRFSTENGVEHRPIEEALTVEAESRPYDPQRYSVSPFHYLTRGRYADLLEPWLEAFGADRMHVVVFEHLQGNPRILRGLHEFLEVDPHPIDPMQAVNHSIGPMPILPPAFGRELRATYAMDNRRLGEMFELDLEVWDD